MYEDDFIPGTSDEYPELDAKSDFYEEHKIEIDFFRSFFPQEDITDLQIVNYIETL